MSAAIHSCWRGCSRTSRRCRSAYAQPYVYRGFQIVNEQKLRELRGDQLRKYSQNGMLQLMWAHVFSLNLMSELFDRQVRMGKVPAQA